jgi:hypothetical protein
LLIFAKSIGDSGNRVIWVSIAFGVVKRARFLSLLSAGYGGGRHTLGDERKKLPENVMHRLIGAVKYG